MLIDALARRMVACTFGVTLHDYLAGEISLFSAIRKKYQNKGRIILNSCLDLLS